MAYGRPIVVAHTKQGDAFAFGLKNGMELTGGTIVSGGAMGDLYGYTLVMSGQEKTPANFIDGATEANPFAGMTTPPTVISGT